MLVQALRPVSTLANLVARIDTIACSSIEKKQSDWLSLILVEKKLNLIQLPELTARSPVNARFQLGFPAAHALIAHRLVARRNSPKWKPAFRNSTKKLSRKCCIERRLSLSKGPRTLRPSQIFVIFRKMKHLKLCRSDGSIAFKR